MNPNEIPNAGHLKIKLRDGLERRERLLPYDLEVTIDGQPLPRNWCGLKLEVGVREVVKCEIAFYPESIDVDTEAVALLARETFAVPDDDFKALLIATISAQPDLIAALCRRAIEARKNPLLTPLSATAKEGVTDEH